MNKIIKKLGLLKIDHTDIDGDGFNRLCSQEINQILDMFQEDKASLLQDIEKMKKKPSGRRMRKREMITVYTQREVGFNNALDDILRRIKDE